jgi:hypothetical protein
MVTQVSSIIRFPTGFNVIVWTADGKKHTESYVYGQLIIKMAEQQGFNVHIATLSCGREVINFSPSPTRPNLAGHMGPSMSKYSTQSETQ